MRKTLNEDLATRNMLNVMRGIRQTNIILNEAYDGNYENSQKLIVVSNQNFPGIVDEIKNSLTQKLPNVKLEQDALKVNPENNTLTLKGKIQNLNNLEFIITTDISDNNPAYITVEGLNLTPNSIQALQILNGYAQVFFNEWTIDKVEDTFRQGQNNLNNQQQVQ